MPPFLCAAGDARYQQRVGADLLAGSKQGGQHKVCVHQSQASQPAAVMSGTSCPAVDLRYELTAALSRELSAGRSPKHFPGYARRASPAVLEPDSQRVCRQVNRRPQVRRHVCWRGARPRTALIRRLGGSRYGNARQGPAGSEREQQGSLSIRCPCAACTAGSLGKVQRGAAAGKVTQLPLCAAAVPPGLHRNRAPHPPCSADPAGPLPRLAQ